jgi:hypothetical protein
MMVLIKCADCEFQVPLDKVGAALMTEHLQDHDREQPADGPSSHLSE